MKRADSPSLYARLYKKGKVVSRIQRYRKQSFLKQVKARFASNTIDKLYFLFRYDRQHHNSGVYDSFKDFKKAYLAFTDKSLISYVRG